ncbi:MAG: hypothetical protein FWD57_12950 [Polyangiaceae bacterium]|nr:hypothetical protein [Polyangiaceae bacterium]
MRETAAPEALAAITVATSVARKLLPMTDEFRICIAHSSRAGGTEPTVTVGSVLYRPSRRIEPAARAEHRSKNSVFQRTRADSHGCMDE